MTDEDIYQYSANIIGSIVTDLSLGTYAKLGGSLTISWCPEPRVRAWAESMGGPEEPPKHNVVISYELARRFYRDAEDFHDFCGGGHLNGNLAAFFSDFDPKPQLSPNLSREASVQNMFIGAITWVFFHELGHLVQEHGHIRKLFSNGSALSLLVDCELSSQHPLDTETALICHVTEFAADREATLSCTLELVRHFLSVEGKWDSTHASSFRDTLFLFVCGLSAALYRFHGERPEGPEAVPSSSHPTPVRRLEACLPSIYETCELMGEHHGMNRRQLVCLCSGAAYSVGFFWHSLYSKKDGIPDNFLIKGLLQDPYKESYWPAIIASWAKIEPEVRRIRRFGAELAILSFTDDFRNRVTSL